MKINCGKRVLSKLAALFLFFTFFVSFAPCVSAITIYPSFTDLTGEKGESFVKTITLVNDSEETQTFLLEGADVRFSQEGVPQFLLVADIPPDSILWWLSFDRGPYLLAPGEEEKVVFSLSVPDTTDPGGHYGAILVSPFTPADKDQSAARLESKVASLLFINVEGEVDQSFSVASFSPEKGSYTSLPVSFSLLVRNDGNTHLQPYGTISVHNALTRRRVANILVNEDFSYLFPGTVRSLPVEWEARGFPPFWPFYFGKYRALLELKTATGPTVIAEAYFWIIPIKVILILIATALAAFLGLRFYGAYLVKRTQK